MQKYKKLTIKTNLVPLILDYTEKSDPTSWIHAHGFDILKLPKNLFDNDPVCAKIFANFDCRPMVFKMQANTFYKLHVDHERGAAINLFLSGKDSTTFFGDATADAEIVDVEFVHYEQDYFYLLNTQKEHAVLNGNNDRYMLSMGFFNHYPFQQVLDFCIANQMVE